MGQTQASASFCVGMAGLVEANKVLFCFTICHHIFTSVLRRSPCLSSCAMNEQLGNTPQVVESPPNSVLQQAPLFQNKSCLPYGCGSNNCAQHGTLAKNQGLKPAGPRGLILTHTHMFGLARSFGLSFRLGSFRNAARSTTWAASVCLGLRDLRRPALDVGTCGLIRRGARPKGHPSIW